MDALDCPDASQLAPKRTESLTALHALALLHDGSLVRQCEHFATRAEHAADTRIGRITFVYRWLFGREPTGDELSLVGTYVEKHGLANACRFLLNSNEFLFVD
jgi:hypothetical protein